MKTITGLEELKQAEGEVLGTSDWHEVTQADVDAFADVTGDHQWIHVDVERAKETPVGAQTTMVMTLEREGAEKPVCVAETLVRAYE